VNPFGSGEMRVMTAYDLSIGMILILGSMCMIGWPRAVWYATRGWRYANPEQVQLSAAHLTWTRISGAVGVILGIALILYTFR
jgi:NhaP-type Na+/H+ and K+/H+ antiporter